MNKLLVALLPCLCFAGPESFTILEDSVQSIYQQQQTESPATNSLRFALSISMGFAEPWNLVMQNQYFHTHYDTADKFPLLSLNLATKISATPTSQWHFGTYISYAKRQVQVLAVDTNDLQLDERVQLQWMQLGLLLRTHSTQPWLRFLYVQPMAGLSWLHQVGSLDGNDLLALSTNLGLACGWEYTLQDTLAVSLEAQASLALNSHQWLSLVAGARFML